MMITVSFVFSFLFMISVLAKMLVIYIVSKKIVHFYIFFLGVQCVESGVSCTDCY